VAGLSYGDSTRDYTEIDYGINLRTDTVFAVYENGTLRGTFGNYSTNDVFRVEVRYGVVRYLRNGSVFYTSAVAPRYPLRLDVSLKDQNASLTNARLGNLVWTGAASVSISGESLTKTGSAGWNGGAVSTNTIESGDGFAEFTATETNTTRIAGLANGDASQSDSDVEFGIKLRDDGYIEVVESGTSRGTVGSYLAGDRLRVEVTSGVVRYYNNGVLLYTSGVTPSYPLRVDTGLYTIGATLTNVSLETLVWTGATGVSVNGAGLVKTSGDGWNANASSTQAITQLDGWMEFTAIETNTRRVAGLKTAGSASDYTNIDFAIDLGSSGVVTIWELGTSRGTFGSYASGDRLRVEIQDGVVLYRKNGTLLYTSTIEPSYPLHVEAVLYNNGATLADVAMGLLVWRSEVGVTFRGNSLVKTGSSTAWDSGAFSTKAINSGSVEWVAFEAPTYRMAGLGRIDSNQNYTDIDFGIDLRGDGDVAIYESGTLRSVTGTYVAGDRFKVEVISGVVKYYQNGTLLYTSGVTPTLPLNVDTSIRDTNGTLFHLALNGDAVVQQLDPPSISPAGGTFTAQQTITLSHSLSEVTIRYTTDGSTPTPTSTVYSSPLTVSATTTIKARAWKTTFLASNESSATYTLRVPNVSIAPGSANYDNPQSVTLTESLSGATIRYTTNGTDPTSASTLYTGPITVDVPLTLKARAFKSGWLDSNVVSATYTFKVATPAFSPAAGNYSAAQTVAITSATTGATLRYTTDGSVPTTSSAVVPGGGLLVDKSTTVKVRGFRTGWTNSDLRQGTYMITLGTVAAPQFSSSGGTYTSSQTVSLSSTTSGATIRYTTDGTDPTARSPIYTSPILIEGTTSLKAKAFKGDYSASTDASGLFVIDSGTVDTPRLSPGSGTYATSQTVTITTETSGATIHYTTNGNEPTESDPTVASGGTLTIEKSKSLKVKAWKSGMSESAIGRGDYHITGAVALGYDFTIALKADGTIWSWGANGSGQLGLGSTGGTHTTAAQITSVTGFTAISAGTNHTLAVKGNGTAWAWGSNSNGQLGDGTMTTRTAPVQVNTLTNVIAVAAGEFHSIALKADGTVWEWGSDTYTNYGTTPVQIAGLKGITAIGAKRNHCFALQTDGEASGALWVWGYDDLDLETSGALSSLGDGSMLSQPTPVRVVGMSNVVKFSAGWWHALALKQDGSVWGWGQNHLGQLGDGTLTGRNIPVQTVQAINAANPILSLGAGRGSGLLLQRKSMSGQSSFWTWGNNAYGALGAPTSSNQVPYPVLSLMTGAFDSAVAERDFVAALHLDGGLWMWGFNGAGQLGDGTTTDRVTPTAVSGFSLVDDGWLLTDSDEDGLLAWVELEIGSDPGNSDTNGDGISDGAAFASNLSLTKSDIDGDGVSNIKERERGTDPFRADSDDDATNDSADCFPLDPTRSSCPAPNSSDTTPPTITLTRPTNATLTGTNP
jgi:alpha-tubulin suppressor-like RCC1 family protein